MIRIAVLADPHLHDTDFGDAAPAPLVRSLTDTLHSTRIFNESAAALNRALAEIAAEEVDLILVAGDLTDDGQPANWAAVARVLADHTARYGTRFLACPGNHDQWAMAGKPLTKGCVTEAGEVFSVGSAAGDVSCAGMRMAGYGEVMAHAAALGYVRDPRDLHWETPFGTSDRVADRTRTMTGPDGHSAPVFDASYLVEPVAGLWILSVDANVYLPDGRGGFLDCGSTGWPATLAHKPWLLPWMKDVADRARRQGKRLVTMSHFPAVDVFGGSVDALDALDPRPDRRRMPDAGTVKAIAATGIGLHFSGHWHISASAADASGALINEAVPSTIAFPAGWKLLTLDDDGARVEDRALGDPPGWSRFHPRYRAEAQAGGTHAPALDAATYDDFLDLHFRNLVLKRRLADDWPAAMAPLVADLAVADLPGGTGSDLAFAQVFVDWYRLRETGGAAAGVPKERRLLYQALADARRKNGQGPEDALLSVFFDTLAAHLGADAARRRARAILCGSLPD